MTSWLQLPVLAAKKGVQAAYIGGSVLLANIAVGAGIGQYSTNENLSEASETITDILEKHTNAVKDGLEKQEELTKILDNQKKSFDNEMEWQENFVNNFNQENEEFQMNIYY